MTETQLTDTRTRILEAAVKVFIEQGYARATTRRIAAEADVNEVTLFRHFGNKLNLIVTALDETTGHSTLQRVIEEDMTGDLIPDLQRIGTHIITMMLKDRDVMRLLMCEAHQITELHDLLRQNAQKRREVFMTYFNAQIAKGGIRTDIDSKLMTSCFSGMLFGYGSTLRHDETPDSPEVIAARVHDLIDLFINGIKEK